MRAFSSRCAPTSSTIHSAPGVRGAPAGRDGRGGHTVEDELAEAIERPARRRRRSFEPGLVAQIVADVRDQPGALPLLQYALTELFAGRTGDALTLEGYLATGGVVGALGRRAEELYARLRPSAQAAAARSSCAS